MLCGGDREKYGDVKVEQKWEYINLSDFKSSGFGKPLSYLVLWIMLTISIAVYVVDLFTCINLLVFDKWSSSIQPAIPFYVSKWIFAGCIILSLALLFVRWMKALRAIRSGSIAASYLDPLAVKLQSIRLGPHGRGWRRFLVFAALTKSKKGVEYVAVFTYFAFEGWLRVCFAQAPRQFVNGMTLYSITQLDLIPTGDNASDDGNSGVVQFFLNIEALYQKNNQQAIILSGMLFTLVIWIMHVISLIIACLFYGLFLWHYIPSSDGSLKGYCKRKVDKSLKKIVDKMYKKALKKQETMRLKEEAKAAKKSGNAPPQPLRQPTIPQLQTKKPEATPSLPPRSKTTTNLSSSTPHPAPPSRSGTSTTLPSYSSRPPTRNDGSSATLPSYSSRPPTRNDTFGSNQPPKHNGRPRGPARSATQSSGQSTTSFSSNAPLIGGASDMGYGHPGHNDSRPSFDDVPETLPPLNRSMTSNSQQGPQPYSRQGQQPSRAPSNQARRTPAPPQNMGPPPRQNTNMANNYGGDSMGRRTPGAPAPKMGPPPRQNTAMGDFDANRNRAPGAAPLRQMAGPGDFGLMRSQTAVGAPRPPPPPPMGSVSESLRAMNEFGPPSRAYTAPSFDPMGRSTSTAPTPVPRGPPPRQNTSADMFAPSDRGMPFDARGPMQGIPVNTYEPINQEMPFDARGPPMPSTFEPMDREVPFDARGPAPGTPVNAFGPNDQGMSFDPRGPAPSNTFGPNDQGMSFDPRGPAPGTPVNAFGPNDQGMSFDPRGPAPSNAFGPNDQGMSFDPRGPVPGNTFGPNDQGMPFDPRGPAQDPSTNAFQASSWEMPGNPEPTSPYPLDEANPNFSELNAPSPGRGQPPHRPPPLNLQHVRRVSNFSRPNVEIYNNRLPVPSPSPLRSADYESIELDEKTPSSAMSGMSTTSSRQNDYVAFNPSMSHTPTSIQSAVPHQLNFSEPSLPQLTSSPVLRAETAPPPQVQPMSYDASIYDEYGDHGGLESEGLPPPRRVFTDNLHGTWSGNSSPYTPTGMGSNGNGYVAFRPGRR